MNKNIYKDSKWIQKRRKILRRDSYQCQECKRYGKNSEASHVHHVIPVAWCVIHMKLYLFSNKNLLSLCKSCHDKMHDRTNDKLTVKGKQLVARIFQAEGIKWIKEYGEEY